MKSKSSYYDREYEKARLNLMKGSSDIKYNSNKDISPAERKLNVLIGKKLIKEQQDKIEAERNIRKQEKKIYSHSVTGKVDKFLKEKSKGQFVPSSIKKMINKRKLNAKKAIMKGEHGGLVRPGETGYFRSEYNREEKWLS